MNRRPALALGVLIALALPVGLAGCGDDDDDDAASTTQAATNPLPPVIVDIGSVGGTTVEVRTGGTVDITGDDETSTDWTAEIADPDVVSFVPGRDDGSAQFNPGLEATAVGSTEVTLTNSASGESVTFTVDVVDG